MQPIRLVAYLSLVISLSNCSTRRKTVSDRNNFEGGGMYISSIDSAISKQIQIVNFSNNTKGIIFPAAFAQKEYGSSEAWKDVKFFTPDTILIRTIDKAIYDQYCDAIKEPWAKRLPSAKDSTITNLVRDRCGAWSADYQFFDKQIMGYIMNGTDSIIHVKVIDFRKDPHKLKPVLTSGWIGGWHGWFYSNITDIYYHIRQKKVSTNF